MLAKQRDPNEKPGRMFATLAHASDSDTRADCWIGNKLVDPKAGRHHVVPPQDPKARSSLSHWMCLAEHRVQYSCRA